MSQIFLENLDKELSISDIEDECGSILLTIKNNGAPVIETAHSTRKLAISEAISLMLLRGMINETDELFTWNKSEIHLLQYYANALNQWL